MLEVANVETQLSELYVGITYYRLRKEIEYLIRVVNEKRPQYPSANDGFFSQLKMKGSNAFNKGEFEKCSKLLEIAKAYLNDFSKKNEKYSYCFNWTRERMYKLVRKIREQSNNTFLPLVEYATDIILDRSLEYRNNKEFFGDMSWIFFNNPTEFDLINKDISENYVKILNDNAQAKKNALIITSVICLPIIVGLAGAAIGGFGAAAATTTHGLKAVSLGLGMAGGVGILCVSSVLLTTAIGTLSYRRLSAIQRNKIRREFALLPSNKVAASLAKSLAILSVLRKYNDSAYDEYYQSFVEQLIDFRTDIDMFLFIGKENEEDNSKKIDIFYRTELLLKKQVFAR